MAIPTLVVTAARVAAPYAATAGLKALQLIGVATVVTLEFKAIEAFADWRLRRQAAQQPAVAAPKAAKTQTAP
jgi:hypothetical protein